MARAAKAMYIPRSFHWSILFAAALLGGGYAEAASEVVSTTQSQPQASSPGLAAASSTGTAESQESQISNGFLGGIEQRLVGWHGMLSGQVESLGETADKFFDHDITFEEINQTSARLRLDLDAVDREGTDFNPKLDIKWVLPAAQRRLSLLLTSDDTPNTDDDNLGDPQLGNDDRGSIALDYAISDNETLRTSLSLGLKRDQAYTRLRLRRNFALGEDVKFRVRNKLTYLTKDDLEDELQLDLDIPFGKKLPDTTEFRELTVGGERRPWLFRSGSRVLWFDRKESTLFKQRFSLFTRLSRRSLIAYELTGQGCTDPNIIDETEDCQKYALQLRYKWVTKKYPWLSFMVQPVVAFPEKYDFKFSPEIRLRADIWLGKGKRVQSYSPVRF